MYLNALQLSAFIVERHVSTKWKRNMIGVGVMNVLASAAQALLVCSALIQLECIVTSGPLCSFVADTPRTVDVPDIKSPDDPCRPVRHFDRAAIFHVLVCTFKLLFGHTDVLSAFPQVHGHVYGVRCERLPSTIPCCSSSAGAHFTQTSERARLLCDVFFPSFASFPVTGMLWRPEPRPVGICYGFHPSSTFPSSQMRTRYVAVLPFSPTFRRSPKSSRYVVSSSMRCGSHWLMWDVDTTCVSFVLFCSGESSFPNPDALSSTVSRSSHLTTSGLSSSFSR